MYMLFQMLRLIYRLKILVCALFCTAVDCIRSGCSLECREIKFYKKSYQLWEMSLFILFNILESRFVLANQKRFVPVNHFSLLRGLLGAGLMKGGGEHRRAGHFSQSNQYQRNKLKLFSHFTQ